MSRTYVSMKPNRRVLLAPLLAVIGLLLSSCGGAGPGGGTTIPEAETANLTGRVVIPLELLGSDIEYDTVFSATRVWLFDSAGEPITSVEPSDIGEFSFSEVDVSKGPFRLVAIVGSGEDSLTLENQTGTIAGGETLSFNITLETTVSSAVLNDPELLADYQAQYDAVVAASYEEGVEPITAEDLQPGDFALIGFDDSSLADGLPAGAATQGFQQTAFKKIERCHTEWFLMWPSTKCTSSYIRVPDLVIKIPDPNASVLAPRLIDFTLPGERIAAKITDAERRVAMRINADGEVEFFSNGIIATGGLNIIATGGLNIIATGGGNIIATGGGNIIATGGGNIIATGGGNVLAPGQAALFSPAGGHYSGPFAMVSSGLLSRINDPARVAQFAAGQIGAQQLMSNISAGIIATGGGNIRRIQSVGEPVTEPSQAKTVAADPKPPYTEEQIEAVLQAVAPPRIHEIRPAFDPLGPKIDMAPGGKLRIEASYVEEGMEAVWTGNFTGYELSELVPYGSVDGHFEISIPSVITTPEANLTIVKRIGGQGHPGEAVRFSNSETIVFDRASSFDVALLLHGSAVVPVGQTDYGYEIALGNTSNGTIVHGDQIATDVEVLFRFDNRAVPVSVDGPDGGLSSSTVKSSSLETFADPAGGRDYLRLPLNMEQMGNGLQPSVVFNPNGLHTRTLFIYNSSVTDPSSTVSGTLPDWNGEAANIQDRFGATHEIAADGSFEFSLPSTVSSGLETIDFSNSSCENDFSITPSNAQFLEVTGFSILESVPHGEDPRSAPQIGATNKRTHPYEGELTKGMKTAYWIYVDRDVTVDGERNCASTGGDHIFRIDDLTLTKGWNQVASEYISVDHGVLNERLSRDTTGAVWYWMDFR